MATLTASTPFRMDLANPLWDAWNAYGSNTSNLQWTTDAQDGPSGTYYNTALEFWWHNHSRVLHFAGDSLNLPYPYPDGFWEGTIQAIFELNPADYSGTARWSLEGISLPANTFAAIGRTFSQDDDRRLFLSFFDRADTFHLSNAADVAMGLGGHDKMYGNGGADLLYGGVGSDTLYGESGNDSLHGEAGNDWLDGGLGTDRLEGGVGNDIYIVANADDTVVEGANAGNDDVRAGFSYTLGTNVENLLLTGADNISGTGNALANRLTGNAGHNVLNGGLGNDSLYGGAGNDTLQGGSGRDRLEGGSGNDIYVLADAGDTVVEYANAGTDQARAGYSYTLGANVENLLLTGSANLNGTGNGLGNQLIGNGGHNVLFGHAGDDTLQGGGGNDALYGGNGNDRLASGSGNDTLLGEGGNDLLDGGEGNNNLNAGVGNDTLLSGAGSDTINAGAGNDRVTSGAGGDRVFGLDGNDTVDSGTGHDIVIGGSGNDLLRGGEGNDDLAAETGSDTLDGSAGNDMLRGGAGADLFIFNDGLDTIRNFDAAQDRIDLRSFAGLNTWVDVQDHLRQEAGHVTFRHGDDVLRIDWTQLSALGSDDFVW